MTAAKLKADGMYSRERCRREAYRGPVTSPTGLVCGSHLCTACQQAKEKLDIARQLVKMGIDIIEAGFPQASTSILDTHMRSGCPCMPGPSSPHVARRAACRLGLYCLLPDQSHHHFSRNVHRDVAIARRMLQASPGDFAAVQSIAQTVGREVDGDGYVPVICGLARCVQRDAEVGGPAVLPSGLVPGRMCACLPDAAPEMRFRDKRVRRCCGATHRAVSHTKLCHKLVVAATGTKQGHEALGASPAACGGYCFDSLDWGRHVRLAHTD